MRFRKTVTALLLMLHVFAVAGLASAAGLRKLPYPYTRMVAIMSDTDLSDKDEFENMHRFLNTEADCGPLGKGVGLDVGDTFWMDLYHGDGPDNWRATSKSWTWIYWHNGKKVYADLMQKYIEAGWIDMPHTFFSFAIGSDAELDQQSVGGYLKSWEGDVWSAPFRSEAEKAVAEWKRIGFAPVAWADHANNPWDIMFYGQGTLQQAAESGDSMVFLERSGGVIEEDDLFSFPSTGEVCHVLKVAEEGNRKTVLLKEPIRHCYSSKEPVTIHHNGNDGPRLGGVPESRYYCLDLAIKAGIKFFWTNPPDSMKKSRAFGMRGYESSFLPVRLPDGTRAWGFMRYYLAPEADNASLGKSLKRILVGDQKGGPAEPWTYSIVSTHLGEARAPGGKDGNDDVFKVNGGRWFNAETVEALRLLRNLQDSGKVLVARTTRLLKYNLANEMLGKYADTALGYTARHSGEYEEIVIHKINDEVFGPYVPELEDLRGITFYCVNPRKVRVYIGEARIPDSELQVNAPDQSGRASIGIKWFKRDVRDYTAPSPPGPPPERVGELKKEQQTNDPVQK